MGDKELRVRTLEHDYIDCRIFGELRNKGVEFSTQRRVHQVDGRIIDGDPGHAPLHLHLYVFEVFMRHV